MTQREYKVPYNSALANHYGQEAYDWCERYGVGKQVTFSLAKYTEAGAMWLAQLWADRMDYFFHLALESGQLLTYIYEADDIEGAPGPALKCWPSKIACPSTTLSMRLSGGSEPRSPGKRAHGWACSGKNLGIAKVCDLGLMPCSTERPKFVFIANGPWDCCHWGNTKRKQATQ